MKSWFGYSIGDEVTSNIRFLDYDDIIVEAEKPLGKLISHGNGFYNTILDGRVTAVFKKHPGIKIRKASRT